MEYKDLLKMVEEENIELFENTRIGRLKGLNVDDTITLNTSIKTAQDKKGVLAEELGHYFTTFGDIRDKTRVENVQKEKRARAWGYEQLVGMMDLISAYENGIRNRFELAEYLDVTEDYISDALNHYKDKYGLYYQIDNYTVYFDPLVIFKKF
ncbi:protein of unknown function DUF955 [Alkaliphilus metalliredigens QYMF]|uniref:IrrE N-terminal-like domain-containing protein n=1 Tax=Alkaliphilus metalliredigens (strain QYMF) TaxID=293826 RepID=A6TLJ4_ALKMQ|nr:ImmA/IrrE family metallo-endopeptidase [Alkaliphilus metalliredigens]ABR47062.1 protein of unknown function DUF955 [Alkaliphilus metalliredigens QYMF]